MSASRRGFLFTLVAIAISFLLPALMEGVFRMTGLFAYEPLLVEVPNSDGRLVLRGFWTSEGGARDFRRDVILVLIETVTRGLS